MSNLIDTLLNVMVFAFIGLLIWLYFKPRPSDASVDALVTFRFVSSSPECARCTEKTLRHSWSIELDEIARRIRPELFPF